MRRAKIFAVAAALHLVGAGAAGAQSQCFRPEADTSIRAEEDQQPVDDQPYQQRAAERQSQPRFPLSPRPSIGFRRRQLAASGLVVRVAKVHMEPTSCLLD